MLLNISNHPAKEWSPAQLGVAEKIYGEVVDLPFPAIAPAATEAELLVLSGNYLRDIQKIKPSAVHIMGEMTFVYTLVQMLQRSNIVCMASTSNRIVQKNLDGSTSRVFEFSGFRKYPRLLEDYELSGRLAHIRFS